VHPSRRARVSLSRTARHGVSPTIFRAGETGDRQPRWSAG
jgi:hypothetical protein